MTDQPKPPTPGRIEYMRNTLENGDTLCWRDQRALLSALDASAGGSPCPSINHFGAVEAAVQALNRAAAGAVRAGEDGFTLEVDRVLIAPSFESADAGGGRVPLVAPRVKTGWSCGAVNIMGPGDVLGTAKTKTRAGDPVYRDPDGGLSTLPAEDPIELAVETKAPAAGMVNVVEVHPVTLSIPRDQLRAALASMLTPCGAIDIPAQITTKEVAGPNTSAIRTVEARVVVNAKDFAAGLQGLIQRPTVSCADGEAVEP